MADRDFLALLEDTLRFEYEAGAVTSVDAEFTTGWRVMDMATSAQISGGRFRVEVEGAPPVEIDEAGNCVPAGVKHRISLVSGAGVVSRWSHVRFTVLARFDALALFAVPVALAQDTAEEIGRINTALAELHRRGFAGVPDVIRRKALGLHLFEALIRGREFRPGALERLREVERINAVLQRIQENLHRPLPIAELARSMRLSDARFYAVFKSATGSSPSGYVREARMQRARQLLLGSALSVAEVAERVGFDDQFHFSRAFKRATGASPVDYRKRTASTM